MDVKYAFLQYRIAPLSFCECERRFFPFFGGESLGTHASQLYMLSANKKQQWSDVMTRAVCPVSRAMQQSHAHAHNTFNNNSERRVGKNSFGWRRRDLSLLLGEKRRGGLLSVRERAPADPSSHRRVSLHLLEKKTTKKNQKTIKQRAPQTQPRTVEKRNLPPSPPLSFPHEATSEGSGSKKHKTWRL